MSVPKQQDVLNTEWKNLIILDACRFDYFYSNTRTYNVKKRISPGSSTPEWLFKTFTDYVDADYYSSNPYINSMSKPLNKTSEMDYGWYPGDYFRRIYDLWIDCWDDNHNTIFPERMVRYGVKKYNPNHRSIFHFIQPHVPYLHTKPLKEKTEWESKNNVLFTKITKKTSRKDEMVNTIITKIPYVNEHQILQWHIRNLFKCKPRNLYEIMWREYGIKKIKDLYRMSLDTTLEHVLKLIKILDGRTIITADHGEMLGEFSYYGHKNEWHVKPLVEVPWMEVNH